MTELLYVNSDLPGGYYRCTSGEDGFRFLYVSQGFLSLFGYTESELKSVSKTTPSLIGKTIVDARSKASSQGITLKVIGSGETVLSQVPSAGQSIPEKGVIIAYTEKNARSEKVKVPDFTGMTAAEVNETAVRYGLNVAFSGPYQSAGALVYKQSIATDTEVQAGSRLTVYFQATANMND